jgi:hypothetical protein
MTNRVTSGVPTFFFSHARQDREARGRLVDKFFEDLEARLAQIAGVDSKTIRLGTIDRNILQGRDWDRALSQPLSICRSFVMLLTPLYVTRENCGKELYVFCLRSPNVGVDTNGSLVGVENIIPIRWLRKEAYYLNTEANSVIPLILRRINDTPADGGHDPEFRAAIERYREKGMERCVDNEPHYAELLDAIALRMRDLPALPPASNVSFATSENAFAYDWTNRFTCAGETVAVAPTSVTAPLVLPEALSSVVVFYVTRSKFVSSSTAVDFADQLIMEPMAGSTGPTNPDLAALLADVRAAALSEGLTVFHAAGKPVIPVNANRLLASLTRLSKAAVLTALIVDSTVWPGVSTGDEDGSAIEQIIRSGSWAGPVIVHVNSQQFDRNEVAIEGLSRRFVALPEGNARITELQRTFIDARGHALRDRFVSIPDAERVPLLKNSISERR